ncbi:DNRLRE domain-containing protein [Mariniflexile gromovii]|uniref:DNRLRE domain-containing protein n=1 Tax=Mariniflexile gromovii TaxID=362523 RepID=A0ABS4BTX0_9FLAO|nr:DNRLRE domain-containing protein [Mariniflexile gromovii]MBP0904011.1 DNRLRE domain-containing protein [Mariniflexile gromovii]
MTKKITQNHFGKSILNKKICSILFFWFLMIGSVQAQFVHPGLWHKKSDLDRMKYMIEANVDPYISSYNNLKSDGKSSYDYVVRKDPNDHTLSRENPSHQRYQYESDALAAYQNALMWYITGDTRHAEKSIEILNAWSKLVSFFGGGTEPLCAGLYGAPLINAAEIIKSTYTGWAANDIQAFKDMLVYPGYSNTTIPQTDINNDNVTFYWRTFMGDPGRHGNQGLLAWRTVMAIGVFLDNEIIYDRALRQIQGLPHRADDIPYPSGPAITNPTPLASSNEYYDEFQLLGRENTIEDYGFDDQIQHYIYDNGQCQESSRDQVHSSLGIGTIAEMMEVAWNQGTDLYSFLDDRVLKGLEFTTKYNLSSAQSYPDQTTAWEPPVFYQYTTRTGRWKSLKINPWVGADLTRNSRGAGVILRPIYELAVAHFTVRENKASNALWTTRAREFAIGVNGYEKGDGTDAPGWGGLTFRRPIGCAGDPISGFASGLPVYSMKVLPETIEAENFDYFSADGEGRTYHDNSSGNLNGAYRTREDVDIESTSAGGYNLTSIESGEWLTYTISAPETAVYGVTIRYAASQAGGTIKFSAGGEDKTIELAVPFGTPNSTGDTDWKEYVISNDVILNKGVQSLKITFGGISGSFKLDNFTLTQSGIVKEDQTIKFFTIPVKLISSTDFEAEATASSGLPVNFTSSNTAVATIVNGKIHIVGTGTTTITATQAGNTYYNAAPGATQELHVVNAVDGSLNLITVADTYVNDGASSTNYGTDASMVTKVSGRYAFLKFDLNSVPGSIISAKLRVFQRTNFQDTRVVYDVADDSWTETELKWINKPPFGDARASSLTNKATWCEWDVSSYVAQEYASDKMISMVIKDPVTSGIGVDFRTKEFELGSVAPVLVIEYSNASLSVASEDVKIDMYPNPVSDELNISLDSANLNIKDTKIALYTLNGQKVMETKFNTNNVKMDLSKLSRGVYLLTINDTSKSIPKKIVKL